MRLLRLTATLVGCLVLVLVVRSDAAAKDDRSALERSSRILFQKVLSFVLEAKTTIGDIEFDDKEGVVRIADLVVHNPEGFSDRPALTAKKVRIEADPDLFTAEKPTIHLVSLDGVNVFAEQSLKRGVNLKKIYDSAHRIPLAKRPRLRRNERRSDRKLLIQEGRFEGGTVNLAGDLLLGQSEQWKLEPFTIDFREEGDGVTVREALAKTMGQLLDHIGGDLLKDLPISALPK